MIDMFVFPISFKSQQQATQYNYYEKQVIPNVTFISADVPVIFRFTFNESESYDFETNSFRHFPKEVYGLRVDVTVYDESMLYGHDDDKLKQMALDTESYRIKTEMLYNKIRQERGGLPEIDIDSYVDHIGAMREENRRECVTYSERYVGRY